MPETQAAKEQSKPRQLIQACLHLLLYRAGKSRDPLPRRELVSAERRIPTHIEFRSFGKGGSVPFGTLPCDLSYSARFNTEWRMAETAAERRVKARRKSQDGRGAPGRGREKTRALVKSLPKKRPLIS